MTKKNELSYAQSMEKIQKILSRIETSNEKSDIDSLIKDVEEAASLITLCRNKLMNAETKIQTVLESLEKNEKLEVKSEPNETPK
jgi:exodeoxyribonuclease VII small subunit